MKLNPKHLEISIYPDTRQAGGQHVGTSPSGVKIVHIPTSIGAVCYSERSQYANKEKALAMLEILVELEIGED